MDSHCRRSFVDHRRKSITFSNIFSDDNNEELKDEKPKLSIKSYLESLKREKLEWKDLLREKKMKLKESENLFKSTPLIITRADVDKFLTKDDKNIIEIKPNYLGMVELVKKYVDAVTYLNRYKSDIIDYYNTTCNELEIDKKILVKEMCSSDLCEICNVKGCLKQDHEFIL